MCTEKLNKYHLWIFWFSTLHMSEHILHKLDKALGNHKFWYFLKNWVELEQGILITIFNFLWTDVTGRLSFWKKFLIVNAPNFFTFTFIVRKTVSVFFRKLFVRILLILIFSFSFVSDWFSLIFSSRFYDFWFHYFDLSISISRMTSSWFSNLIAHESFSSIS